MSNKDYLPEDQISLNNLRLTVRFLLKLFFRFCSFVGLVIEKGRFIMLVGLLVGAGIGATYYFNTPKYYKGTMIVTASRLYKKTFADIIEQLNSISSIKTGESLAGELNVSPQTAAQIRFFDSKNMLDSPLKEDTSTKRDQPFKIIIGLNSVDSIAQLQQALVDYLNNRPYLKHIREEEAKIYTAKLNQIENELAKIDSLKAEFNRFLATSKISATVYSSAINPAEIYEQSINLMREKENAQRVLMVDNYAVSVLDGFKVNLSARPVPLVRLLILTGTMGIILGFVIAFLIETRKKIAPEA